MTTAAPAPQLSVIVQDDVIAPFNPAEPVIAASPGARLVAVLSTQTRIQLFRTCRQGFLEPAGALDFPVPLLSSHGAEWTHLAFGVGRHSHLLFVTASWYDRVVVFNALERALARLPAEHREILLLREIEDLGYEDIAAVLGIHLGTVKSRLARARAGLLEHMPP